MICIGAPPAANAIGVTTTTAKITYREVPLDVSPAICQTFTFTDQVAGFKAPPVCMNAAVLNSDTELKICRNEDQQCVATKSLTPTSTQPMEVTATNNLSVANTNIIIDIITASKNASLAGTPAGTSQISLQQLQV